MIADVPVWRSMLFVPANIDRFVAKAHQRGADAVILDLEDSVAPADKKVARAGVVDAARTVSDQGTAVLVRVNERAAGGDEDIAAAACLAVRALVLPKVETLETVQAAAAQLDRIEVERGLPPGHTLLIAQIEDVAALPNLDAIAMASPRLMGMSLGSEDFSVSAGMAPMPQTLFQPNQQVAFACRRAGIQPLGFPGSIADFGDMDRFGATVELARQMGFVGAFCIHPMQVAVLNDGLSPSDAEVEHARGVLEARDAADREGRAAFAYRRRMVDAPVIARAEETLRRHAATRHSSPGSSGSALAN